MIHTFHLLYIAITSNNDKALFHPVLLAYVDIRGFTLSRAIIIIMAILEAIPRNHNFAMSQKKSESLIK